MVHLYRYLFYSVKEEGSVLQVVDGSHSFMDPSVRVIYLVQGLTDTSKVHNICYVRLNSGMSVKTKPNSTRHKMKEVQEI